MAIDVPKLFGEPYECSLEEKKLQLRTKKPNRFTAQLHSSEHRIIIYNAISCLIFNALHRQQEGLEAGL